MIEMNELLVGLCSYLSIQSSNGTQACHAAISSAYTQSSIKPLLDREQKELEQEGLSIYSTLPYNKPLGATLFLANDIYKKDYKIAVASHIDLEYTNYSEYKCTLSWGF